MHTSRRCGTCGTYWIPSRSFFFFLLSSKVDPTYGDIALDIFSSILLHTRWSITSRNITSHNQYSQCPSHVPSKQPCCPRQAPSTSSPIGLLHHWSLARLGLRSPPRLSIPWTGRSASIKSLSANSLPVRPPAPQKLALPFGVDQQRLTVYTCSPWLRRSR